MYVLVLVTLFNVFLREKIAVVPCVKQTANSLALSVRLCFMEMMLFKEKKFNLQILGLIVKFMSA